MMCRSARRLLRILPVIDPPAAFESVALSAAAHELPHAASPSARNSQRMESRLRLREINQFLRNAFFPQNAPNHILVAARASQSTLQRPAPAIGKIINIAGNLVGHDQRQIRMRRLDLGLGLCLYALVNRRSSFVGLVNRSRFRLLLGKAVPLLQGGELKCIDAIENAIELALQTIIRVARPKIVSAAQQ